jgi:hypothetical protein
MHGASRNVLVPSLLNATGFAIALVFLSFAGGREAWADPSSMESAVTATATRRHFDLPAQPVEEALYRLSVTTGVQIFADGQIVAGRQTKAISGDYTTEEALEHLLSGTGLVTRAAGTGAIMVMPGLTGAQAEIVRRDYSTALQHAVLAALCRDGEQALGKYRLAIRMWLTPQGMVEQVDLLSSTGDPERDRRVGRVLRSVTAEQPPKALPQPVIMVILPRSPQESGDCSAASYPTRLP